MNSGPRDYTLAAPEWLKLTADDLMGSTPIAHMFGVRELIGQWDVRVVRNHAGTPIGPGSQTRLTSNSEAVFWECRCLVRFRRMMNTSFKVQHPTVITQNRWRHLTKPWRKQDPAMDEAEYYHFLSFDAALFYTLRAKESVNHRTYSLWQPGDPDQHNVALETAFREAVDTARTLLAFNDTPADGVSP